MAALRSLLFAAIFYPATLLCVLAGIGGSLFGQRSTRAVVVGWVELHRWLAEHVLGIRSWIESAAPAGPHLIAVKHQSMFETIEMLRITHWPVVVIKRELVDIPLFGSMTRRYGVIPVERSAGAKALRALVEEARRAVAQGRSV